MKTPVVESVVAVVPIYMPPREKNENFSGLLIDRHGWEYYDRVPSGYREATLDDFHSKGRKRIGMMFLIRWADKEYYQVCRVSERLTGAFLKPFIESNRVFIPIDHETATK